MNNIQSKQQLGQFFTTNYAYILQNLHIPSNTDYIIEPFVGSAELLNYAKKEIDLHTIKIKCYDIDLANFPKKKFSKQRYNIKYFERDTIENPPNYKNKFVITNPPYLALNKMKNTKYKKVCHKYKVDDLYKCFIKELIVNQPDGGILIIPVNFWSSIRKNDIDLRAKFLKVFNVEYINIFEEQVFEDTSYSVCSFQFSLKTTKKIKKTNIAFYPSIDTIKVRFTKKYNYTIGGNIYNLHNTYKRCNYKITRLTHINKDKKNTNIVVKCIDDKHKIKMSLVDDNELDNYIDYTTNLSSRSYIVLVINPTIDDQTQKALVKQFNKLLNEYREMYHSMFLTSYRENNRKRISFTLVYDIVKKILSENDK